MNRRNSLVAAALAGAIAAGLAGAGDVYGADISQLMGMGGTYKVGNPGDKAKKAKKKKKERIARKSRQYDRRKAAGKKVKKLKAK